MPENALHPAGEGVYRHLSQRWPDNAWLAQVCRLSQDRLTHHSHGDLPRWTRALAKLPTVRQEISNDGEIPRLGSNANDRRALQETLMKLHPWRKGPLRLGGQLIDTEWRSDWKWNRVRPHVDLAEQRVLDIGCGNGYFGLRMLEAGAKLVVGIDPTLLFVMQWLACRHFSGDVSNFVLPLGIEDLPAIAVGFDRVFSMGVLYHRKDPLHHLRRIRSMLRAGGVAVIETLVLPKDGASDLLVPEGRYARMRNVWAIPGADRLLSWVREADLSEARLVSMEPTSPAEQRSTDWMQFESLQQALDAENHGRTVEGHPAPVRAIVVAQRR